MRPAEFDRRDQTLCANHRRGLYYTWLHLLRVHALFLNFEPATYLLEATKVAHIGVLAVASRRRGPQLLRACVWDDVQTSWVEQGAAEDGFSAIVGESGDASAEIQRIAEANPLEAERVLALSAGKIRAGEDWHCVQKLDSCVIGTSEVICRITFCQDTDEHAREFRVSRLRRCGHLWDILHMGGKLPPALSDLAQGFQLGGLPISPIRTRSRSRIGVRH